ncbi:hypothetical protein GCM10027449_23950 [Sinomonas notoginsengisoli]|uniref:hypothetical protein n=1 Tax=Sinomonas notoginsengisoli TaxID=1457311 RepID=UPI001F376407|nr:hypothetical protein [Sinomonas notoginsengisoli]
MRWSSIFKSAGTPRLRHSGAPSHGVGSNPGMPHLAAAQIPGPGVGRMLAGETGTLPDDAADPVEKQGHVSHRRSRRRNG